MRSSDWLANENEWRDSEGNRARSSQEPRVGAVVGNESEFTRVEAADTEGEREGIMNP